MVSILTNNAMTWWYFITTNDTGGNPVLPVIDGMGNLIGLADGNYEALSHKIVFDVAYNRTICVDVRLCIVGVLINCGATNIINELKLVRQ